MYTYAPNLEVYTKFSPHIYDYNYIVRLIYYNNYNNFKFGTIPALYYFDIVRYHVIDPIHHLLLSTAKYNVNLEGGKSNLILTKCKKSLIKSGYQLIR